MSANVNKYYRRVITNCPTSRQPSYWQQIYGTRHIWRCLYRNMFGTIYKICDQKIFPNRLQ